MFEGCSKLENLKLGENFFVYMGDFNRPLPNLKM